MVQQACLWDLLEEARDDVDLLIENVTVWYINCFKWFVPAKNWSSMQNVQHNSLWWILVQLFYGVTTLAGCIAKSGLMNLGSKGMVSASKPTITLIEVTVNLPWKTWNELLMQPFEFISSCTCACRGWQEHSRQSDHGPVGINLSCGEKIDVSIAAWACFSYINICGFNTYVCWVYRHNSL